MAGLRFIQRWKQKCWELALVPCTRCIRAMNESARPRNTFRSSSHHFSLSLSVPSVASLCSFPISSLHSLSVSGSRSTLGRGLRFLIYPSYEIIVPSALNGTSAFCSCPRLSLLFSSSFRPPSRHMMSSI